MAIERLHGVYKGKIKNADGTTDLFYEYRGHEYMVTDYGWSAMTNDTLGKQHKREQDRIDTLFEKKESKGIPADISELWDAWES